MRTGPVKKYRSPLDRYLRDWVKAHPGELPPEDRCSAARFRIWVRQMCEYESMRNISRGRRPTALSKCDRIWRFT